MNDEAADAIGKKSGCWSGGWTVEIPPASKVAAASVSHEKGRDKDLSLYTRIERMAPQLIAQERKIFKGVSPNVDFYSGFVYEMLGIPMELYTPLFAVARVMGWSAHRIEELLSANKIIRPAYKSLGGTHDYIPRSQRT